MNLYGARDKKTNKLVSDITNPRHKFWESEKRCQAAINNFIRYSKKYDLELVKYEL